MLFNPGTWLAACCALGALMLWWAPPLGRWLVAIGSIGFLLVLVLPLDQWALAPLENRFPIPPADAPVAGIIVLGGTIDSALSADRDMPSLGDSAERLTHFVALARAHPEARLVFTGGSGSDRTTLPEADGARILLQSLGLPPDRVIYEAASRTTWENAVLTRERVHPTAGETWLLITSAAHMPRSVGAFRQAGWHVLADPVGYKTFRDPSALSPRGFGKRMVLLDIAAHEWIGLVAYRLQGRSDAWFPSPIPPPAPPVASR